MTSDGSKSLGAAVVAGCLRISLFLTFALFKNVSPLAENDKGHGALSTDGPLKRLALRAPPGVVVSRSALGHGIGICVFYDPCISSQLGELEALSCRCLP